MAKYYYRSKKRNIKILFKILSLLTLVFGAALFLYIFFPLISWQIYFAPSLERGKIQTPIPTYNVIGPSNIRGLIANAATSLGIDYTNAYNWYPGFERKVNVVTSYKISMPKINVYDAIVTNADTDLTKHMVQYNSDSAPPSSGNSIIFGHSTLPQLFNPKDYKTILANAYKLSVGDEIIAKVSGASYSYRIESVTVVEPTDTSVLSQNFSDSFITIITCAPPGTTWKRLVIKARLRSL